MKAAVLVEPGKLTVQQTVVPEPGAQEVLIRVALAGICGSDHSLFHGRFGVPLPVIPGHEAVGVIEKTGVGVTGLTPGRRVTIQPNFSCGACRLCLGGRRNLCASKKRLGVDANGVFAEFAAVPADYVWPVPEGLADEVAVFTEPLAVLVHAMRICAPQKGDRTLVFGAGVMGLLALQMAVDRGADVAACDLSETRLAIAGRLGASRTIGPDEPLEPLSDSYDVIYETSGTPAGLSQVVRLAAPRGRIVLLSLPGKEHPLSTDMVVRKEITVMGSLIYTDEFPESIRLLEAGRVQTGPLTTGRLSLEEVAGALERFASPGRLKMLVEI